MAVATVAFELLRFEAHPSGAVAVLELDGRFSEDLRAPARPRLLVEGSGRPQRELPAIDVTHEPWSATFAVPLDLVSDRGATYALVPERGPLVALPSPDLAAGSDDRYVRLARAANRLRHQLAQATELEPEADRLRSELEDAAAERERLLAEAAAERDRLLAEAAAEHDRLREDLADAAEEHERLRDGLRSAEARASEAEQRASEADERVRQAERRLEEAVDESRSTHRALVDARADARAAHAELERVREQLRAAPGPTTRPGPKPPASDESARLRWEDEAGGGSSEPEQDDATARIAALATETETATETRDAAETGVVAEDERPESPTGETGETHALADLDEVRVSRAPARRIVIGDDGAEDVLTPAAIGARYIEPSTTRPPLTALTPARIAVGGVLLVLVIWLLLIIFGVF